MLLMHGSSVFLHRFVYVFNVKGNHGQPTNELFYFSNKRFCRESTNAFSSDFISNFYQEMYSFFSKSDENMAELDLSDTLLFEYGSKNEAREDIKREQKSHYEYTNLKKYLKESRNNVLVYSSDNKIKVVILNDEDAAKFSRATTLWGIRKYGKGKADFKNFLNNTFTRNVVSGVNLKDCFQQLNQRYCQDNESSKLI